METQFVYSATAGDIGIAVILLVFIFVIWSGVALYALSKRSSQWKR